MIQTALERVDRLAADVDDAFIRADLAAVANNLHRALEHEGGLLVMALANADYLLGDLEDKVNPQERHELREIRQILMAPREGAA